MSTSLIRYAMATRWAMEPGVLRSLCALLNRHRAGEKTGPEEIERVRVRRGETHPYTRFAGARPWRSFDDEPLDDERDDREPYLVGRALVVPVRGVIAQYASMVNGVSQPQGMAAERLIEICHEAARDPAVAGVVMHVDSPGGSVAGIADAVAAVRTLAAAKPVYAHANDLMASAALWIGSQASEVSTTPTGMVGSIGVYAVIEDTSAAYAEAGVRRILVASGEHKGAGTDGVPVTDAQLAAIGEECMALSRVFVGDVATGRGVSGEAVAAMADGRMFVGADAQRLGLVDRVCGMDEVIERAQSGRMDRAARAAHNTRIQPMATTDTGPKAEEQAGETMTLDALKAAHPDLMEQHAEEVRKSMQTAPDEEEKDATSVPVEQAATVAEIKAAFPNDPAFRAECIEAGLTMAQAQARRIEALTKQLEEARAEADAVRPKAGGAAPVKFSQPSQSGPADYAAAVREIAARDKVTQPVAMARAAKQHPDLHRAWTGAGCPAVTV